jgi:hypothetical protein
MPYKANEPRRHKIPKARYKIENRAEYDAALRRRGSLTVWVTPEAIAAWIRNRSPHSSMKWCPINRFGIPLIEFGKTDVHVNRILLGVGEWGRIEQAACR